MSDRCYSTLVCAEREKDVFEKIGWPTFRLQFLFSASGRYEHFLIPGAVCLRQHAADRATPYGTLRWDGH